MKRAIGVSQALISMCGRTGTIVIAQSPAGHNWAHGVMSSVKLLQTGEEYCKVIRINA